MSLLRTTQNKEIPLRHKDTKHHKALIICENNLYKLRVTLCLSAFVA